MGVEVFLLYILEMGEMFIYEVWESLFESARKWIITFSLAVVCGWELGFEWGDQKCENCWNQGVWNIFYGFVSTCWWLWGRGVRVLGVGSLNPDLERQVRCYLLLGEVLRDFVKCANLINDLQWRLRSDGIYRWWFVLFRLRKWRLHLN